MGTHTTPVLPRLGDEEFWSNFAPQLAELSVWRGESRDRLGLGQPGDSHIHASSKTRWRHFLPS